MGFLKTVFSFVLASTLTVFAIFNRQTTEFSYSPLHDPVQIPLYLICLSFLATGFICGGFIVWINAGKLRKTKRQQRKTIKSLEKELGAFEQNKAQTPPSELFPSLPYKKQDKARLPDKENSSIKEA